MTEHIERKTDRRKGQSVFYDAVSNRRRPQFERRVGQHAPAQPGTVRPGYGEAPPPMERRRYLDGGME